MKFIKNNLRLIIPVGIAIILIVVGVILLIIKDEEKPMKPNNEVNKEEQITTVTGMSGEDAIDLVKKNFYGDNYTFTVEVTQDSLYRVIASNTTTNTKTIYYVDPANGQAYVDIDTN